MYRSRTVKTSSKKLILSAIILITLLLIGTAIWYFFLKQTDPTKSYQPEYPSSVKTEPKQSNDTNASTTDDYKTNDENSTPSLETSNQVPIAKVGSIEVTNLNQNDGFVNVLATVSNFETSKCVYSFTAPDARPVVREVIGNCTGVSIPEVEFEIIGNYTLTATAYSGSEKLTAAKDIDIK